MVDDKRIEKARNEGENAFWEAVAAQFPEVKTGDLSPDASFALTQAMESAIREWLDANLPSET